MSTINDVVLGALSDAPIGRQQIAEATGLELALISTTLTALKNQGLAERADGGWVAGGGGANIKAARARGRRTGDETASPRNEDRSSRNETAQDKRQWPRAIDLASRCRAIRRIRRVRRRAAFRPGRAPGGAHALAGSR
jgi:hypothetical protein